MKKLLLFLFQAECEMNQALEVQCQMDLGQLQELIPMLKGHSQARIEKIETTKAMGKLEYHNHLVALKCLDRVEGFSNSHSLQLKTSHLCLSLQHKMCSVALNIQSDNHLDRASKNRLELQHLVQPHLQYLLQANQEVIRQKTGVIILILQGVLKGVRMSSKDHHKKFLIILNLSSLEMLVQQFQGSKNLTKTTSIDFQGS